MHILGTILAWLSVILAAVAVYFTSEMIAVRNSWTKKNDQLKQQYEQVAPQVRQLELRFASLENEVTRTMLPWDRFWNNVPTQVADPNVGAIGVELGQNAGVQQGEWLYGFEPLPEGGYIYRGKFEVVEARENQSLLRPRFRPRAADIQRWRPGTWRWRAMIPTGYAAKFEDIDLQLLEVDALLADRQNTLNVQTQLVEAARQQLEQRNNELFGGPLLPENESLDPEYTNGLLPTLASTEDERNAVLIEVDQLRRDLRKTNAEFQRVQQENLKLANRLPQPTSTGGQ